MLVIAIAVSTASAGKDLEQYAIFSTLKDQVQGYASAVSSNYAQSYVQAIASSSGYSEGTAVAEGDGDYLSLVTGLTIISDDNDNLYGIGESYVSADDEVEAGTESSIDISDLYNSINIFADASGTGNAEGYACVHGWERYC